MVLFSIISYLFIYLILFKFEIDCYYPIYFSKHILCGIIVYNRVNIIVLYFKATISIFTTRVSGLSICYPKFPYPALLFISVHSSIDLDSGLACLGFSKSLVLLHYTPQRAIIYPPLIFFLYCFLQLVFSILHSHASCSKI